MLLFDDRETSWSIATMFADASPKLRRCFGDASATSWDCFDIGRHRECCKKIQCMHWNFSRCIPELLSQIYVGDASPKHRRSIAEASAMHPRSFRDMLLFPRHPRSIRDNLQSKGKYMYLVEINLIIIFYSGKGHNEYLTLSLPNLKLLFGTTFLFNIILNFRKERIK